MKFTMKTEIILSLLLVLVVLFSCQAVATFNNPQPNGIDPIKGIPVRLQGRYASEDRQSILTITDSVMLRTYQFEDNIHKDSLQKGTFVKGDSLLVSTNGERKSIRVHGDSILIQEHWVDTLFTSSPMYILKAYKGYYFLNRQLKDNTWEVMQLFLRRGKLYANSLSTPVDIEKLKSITENASDTVPSSFTLTQKQFKKFIRKGGFAEQEIFIRLKSN